MTIDIASLVSDNLNIWTTAVERKSGAGRGGGGKRVNLYGIGRLRALILDLAMRGKLASQDADDDHASALLHQVAMEGVKSAALSKRRARNQLEVSDSIVPLNELPEGWIWVRLAEMTRVIRGVTYGKSDASDRVEEGKICLLRGHNIQSTINFEDLVFVPVSKVSEVQVLQRGDILIAMSSGSSDLVGKGAPYTSDRIATFGAFCGVIRPFSELIWPYLTLFCKTPLYRMQTRKGGRGIGIQNLSKGDLEQLQCPLPPLAEQQRIVAKVDELMTLCDALEVESVEAMTAHQALVDALLATLTASTGAADFATNWSRLEAHFDTLFSTEASVDALEHTILELAVRGKLVEQDPQDEPASELLKLIARAQTDGNYKKRITAALESNSVSASVPLGWEQAQVGDVFSIRTGFAFRSSTYCAEGTLVFRVTNFNRQGAYNFADAVYFPTEEIDGKISGFLLDEDDIVMVMVGGTIGKTVIISRAILPALLNQNMWRIRSFGKKMVSEFELCLIKFLNAKIEGLTQSTHGHFAMGDFAKRPVLIPPLAEQYRIVTKVNKLMKLCDELKISLAEAEATQKHLADATVERAAA